MPARVMLLILATAALIAMWSGDHRQPVAKKACTNPADCSARKCRQVTQTSIDSNSLKDVLQSWLFPENQKQHIGLKSQQRSWWDQLDEGPMLTSETNIAVAARKPSHATATVMVEPTDHRDSTTSPIPLPTDLSPGDFRIVNSVGLSFRRTFTATMLAEHGIPAVVPPRNLYVLEVNGTRWYFIRQEARLRELVANLGGTMLQSTMTSSKHRTPNVELAGIQQIWTRLRNSAGEWNRQMINVVNRNIVSPWSRATQIWRNRSLNSMSNALRTLRRWQGRLSAGEKPTRRL